MCIPLFLSFCYCVTFVTKNFRKFCKFYEAAKVFFVNNYIMEQRHMTAVAKHFFVKNYLHLGNSQKFLVAMIFSYMVYSFTRHCSWVRWGAVPPLPIVFTAAPAPPLPTPPCVYSGHTIWNTNAPVFMKARMNSSFFSHREC